MKYIPYKLIGDVVYPIRPWFFIPFKRIKYGLLLENNHYNYI